VLDQGDEDVFFIARMVITCCAVDAQPIGLPVYRPNWKEELRPSTWIAVQGTFVQATGRPGRYPALIQIGTLTRIDEPDNPYAF
jgi:putative membrane protein